MKNPCKECVVRARCMERKLTSLIDECYLIDNFIKKAVKSKNTEKHLLELVHDLKCSKTL
jgi:hypothetical protein